MKLLVIADDDNAIEGLNPSMEDILVSCGDLNDTSLLNIFRKTSVAKFFAVKGNHDADGKFPSPIANLHLRLETHEGLIFGGFQGAWRYKPEGNFLYDHPFTVSCSGCFCRSQFTSFYSRSKRWRASRVRRIRFLYRSCSTKAFHSWS